MTDSLQPFERDAETCTCFEQDGLVFECWVCRCAKSRAGAELQTTPPPNWLAWLAWLVVLGVAVWAFSGGKW